MNAPAHITQSTSDVMREMREEQASSSAAGFRQAMYIAEAALADIGDADREPGDDVAWCEARAAEALPIVRAALAALSEPPEALSDERIDNIADLVVKGMPDGLRGFCRLWGWQRFARALLEVCGVRASLAPAPHPQPVSPADELPARALAAVREPLSDDEFISLMDCDGIGPVDPSMALTIKELVERAHGIGITAQAQQEGGQ